jgi:hypothetical protein
MNVQMNRALAIVMSSLFLTVASCRQAAQDPKAELVRAAKGNDLKRYTFASYEDDAKSSASYTNGGVRDGITLKSDGTVVLKYETIRDKRTNRITTRRVDLVRTARTLTSVITDVSTGRVLDRQSANIPDDIGGGGGGGGLPPIDICAKLPTCAQAIHDYNCRVKPVLQCEANRTCHFQLGGYECRQPNGTCLSALTIVVPDNNPVCAVLHVPVEKLSL